MEVAKAVLYLSAAQGRFPTGFVLELDGGIGSCLHDPARGKWYRACDREVMVDKADVYAILEKQYFGDDPHEKSELRGLAQIFDPGVRQVIDVGASLGQYTRAFSDIARHAQIVSIESDPIRAERLRENASLWSSATGAGIRVVEAAASDAPGECVFYTTESNVSGSINAHTELNAQWKKISVPAITLDDLVSSYDHTFVKMDIEGGEYAALMGAKMLLKGEGNSFLVELHVWGDASRGKKVGDVLDIFLREGYSIATLHNHHLFRKTGSVNRLKYGMVRAYFRLKELIYFSPLRSLAKGLNSIRKGIFGR